MELKWEQIGLDFWCKENDEFRIELQHIGDMEYCFGYINYKLKITINDKFFCIGDIYEVELEAEYRTSNKIHDIIYSLKKDCDNIERGYKYV